MSKQKSGAESIAGNSGRHDQAKIYRVFDSAGLIRSVDAGEADALLARGMIRRGTKNLWAIVPVDQIRFFLRARESAKGFGVMAGSQTIVRTRAGAVHWAHPMKRGTPRHPKVGRLCDELSINIPTAVGLLDLLWHFTAEFAPQGDIGRYEDNRIEAAMLSWFRPKGKLILALIKAGWIDQDPIRGIFSEPAPRDDPVPGRLRLPFAGCAIFPAPLGRERQHGEGKRYCGWF